MEYIRVTRYDVRWESKGGLRQTKSFNTPEDREKFLAEIKSYDPNVCAKIDDVQMEVMPRNYYVKWEKSIWSPTFWCEWEWFDTPVEADRFIEQKRKEYPSMKVWDRGFDNLREALTKLYEENPNAQLSGSPKMGYSNTDSSIVKVKEVL